MSLFTHRLTGRRRRTRGQSLVEFALILPIMLVFLAAVLDLGRVFYATITLNNAAREGAFAAASNPDSFDAGQPCNTATNMVVCRVQLESKDSRGRDRLRSTSTWTAASPGAPPRRAAR